MYTRKFICRCKNGIWRVFLPQVWEITLLGSKVNHHIRGIVRFGGWCSVTVLSLKGASVGWKRNEYINFPWPWLLRNVGLYWYRNKPPSRGPRGVVSVKDGKLWCAKSSWSLKLCDVLGLGFGMGFRIFVRSVLIPRQSLFQYVLKLKVFFHVKGKTTD